MRVLLIHDYSTLTGGAEVQTAALRDGLRARGVDVRLLTSSAHGEGGDLAPDYVCLGTTGRFRTLLQTANPWAALAVRRALASFRPDVVHVRIFLTQLSPLILLALRETPAVYHAVWYRSICPIGSKLLPDGRVCRHRAGRICLREGCLTPLEWAPLMLQLELLARWRNAFDLVVANSAAVRDRLAAEGIGPIEIIGNAVAERPRRPPLADPPTVAFAGRLVREKGVDVLLRAFARLVTRVPDARLLVVGDGPELPFLSNLTGGLGMADRVEFLGRLPRAELESRLESAWVQAVPSVWEEPYGLVGAEAMMRGTAVVASDIGGLPEVVERGGFLVAAGDDQALAAALTTILTNRDMAERMGAQGRAIARERFALDVVVDRWLEVYERLTSRRRYAS